MQKKTGQQKQKCKNCEGKGTLKKREKRSCGVKGAAGRGSSSEGHGMGLPTGVCRHPNFVLIKQPTDTGSLAGKRPAQRIIKELVEMLLRFRVKIHA